VNQRPQFGSEGRSQQAKAIEDALRWLATRGHEPLGFLFEAIHKPESPSGAVLAPLVEPTASLTKGTAKSRALAAWGLIVECVREVGPTEESRRRNVLVAAFRLPRREEILERWVSALDGRFAQLKALPDVFGNPAPLSTAPMHKAWRVALQVDLVPNLQKRLVELVTHGGRWPRYVNIGRNMERGINGRSKQGRPPNPTAGYRIPSPDAQPVFVDLLLTTVFMQRRSPHRRITERLITARNDGVASYLGTAVAGGQRVDNPMMALFGCTAHPVLSRPGQPELTELTELRFPAPLKRGDKHWFSAEVVDDQLTEERVWINVEIDHHGIAPGKLLDGRLPIGGLTIRIRFDDGWPPLACWWYAEQTERERCKRPPEGDPRLLPLVGNTVQHTFLDRCQPRADYGISILWPRR
jgi:hypothetical protein